jgi:hypothetical protein
MDANERLHDLVYLIYTCFLFFAQIMCVRWGRAKTLQYCQVQYYGYPEH